MSESVTAWALLCMASAFAGLSGPYTESGVNGYIDPLTWHHGDPLHEHEVLLNPIFRGWAAGIAEYVPSDQTWIGPGVWNDPNQALGPATGQSFDIVSLGELDEDEIARGVPPGYITLVFGDPCDPRDPGHIRNGRGYDFAVFENAFISEFTTSAGSFAGEIIAELGYVEVSSNGRDFARFPSVSLTPGRVKFYGTVEVSDIHNLAGKHPNSGGACTGTPFDLADLANHPQVTSGAVDLNDIRYVRIVDVPGSGDFTDEAATQVDPTSWPEWRNYGERHPIYDFWPSWGSGGFDLEAVGVLREQHCSADIDLDGVVDVQDLIEFSLAWPRRFGQPGWVGRCNLAQPGDLNIDGYDFAVFAAQWRRAESWRGGSDRQ